MVLDAVAEGENSSVAADQITELGKELKELKVKLSGLAYANDQADEGVSLVRENFLDATAALQQAQQRAFMSGNLTPEINRALIAHHNSAPMPSEGAN